MATHKILENLFLVDLDLPLPGFYRFISSWVIREGDRAVVIDPGPAATINTLHNALDQLGIRTIDYILLTHIHLDHAGGCGDMAERFPDAAIMCHSQAINHLVDPTKLWHGSLKHLGELAQGYGQPSPINSEKIYPESDIIWEKHEIHSLRTPGHASHHVCFFFENTVFAGEVGGVSVPLNKGTYIRPATPPPFKPEIALNSISLVIENEPHYICYSHYGLLEEAVEMLRRAHEQIRLWLNIIERRLEKGFDMDDDEILDEILAKDPNMNSFYQLEADIRKREIFFSKTNSIKGMVDFIINQG
jgi:glyoxylase-like metal-dependent hydrolase (beta-lactamase superfamily II)